MILYALPTSTRLSKCRTMRTNIGIIYMCYCDKLYYFFFASISSGALLFKQPKILYKLCLTTIIILHTININHIIYFTR